MKGGIPWVLVKLDAIDQILKKAASPDMRPKKNEGGRDYMRESETSACKSKAALTR
jgi:hypothetical protein